MFAKCHLMMVKKNKQGGRYADGEETGDGFSSAS